jgi:type II secretory ATPase GspE/PulE/Tfp pilus assembly ATPase PilB-like protein
VFHDALLDLRVPGFLISSTVLGILAQPLVRVITHCAEEYEPAYEESLALNMPFEQPASSTLRKGRGCLHRRQTAYSGRDGIFEIVPIASEMVRVAGK